MLFLILVMLFIILFSPLAKHCLFTSSSIYLQLHLLEIF